MKKRETSKLRLNKKQISTLNAAAISGGKLIANADGSDCEGTCTCNCSDDCTRAFSCGGGKSNCIPCEV